MWVQDFEPPALPGSFHEPIPVLDSEPDAGPRLCVSFNADWRRVICGALLQLMRPQTWDRSDPTALNLQLERSYSLVKLFALAEACPVQEDGLATLTITPGNADASLDIVFSQTYASPPKVDVSCDNPDLIAAWHDVTVTGCTLIITAATPVAADTTGHVSWSTNP